MLLNLLLISLSCKHENMKISALCVHRCMTMYADFEKQLTHRAYSDYIEQ